MAFTGRLGRDYFSKRHRRHCFRVAAALLCLAMLGTDERAADCLAQPFATAPIAVTPGRVSRPISLRDRLIVGLQARLPSEVAFVEEVVQLVQAGQVPQRLVDQTFFWARQRADRSPYFRPRRPMIYFRPAMTFRLRRLGIDI